MWLWICGDTIRCETIIPRPEHMVCSLGLLIPQVASSLISSRLINVLYICLGCIHRLTRLEVRYRFESLQGDKTDGNAYIY